MINEHSIKEVLTHMINNGELLFGWNGDIKEFKLVRWVELLESNSSKIECICQYKEPITSTQTQPPTLEIREKKVIIPTELITRELRNDKLNDLGI